MGAANGVKGSAEALKEALRSPSVIIEVQRKVQFRLQVVVPHDVSHGLLLDTSSGFAIVKNVGPGFVHESNKTKLSDEAIRVGDRIVTVASKTVGRRLSARRAPQIQDALESVREGELELCVKRMFDQPRKLS